MDMPSSVLVEFPYEFKTKNFTCNVNIPPSESEFHQFPLLRLPCPVVREKVHFPLIYQSTNSSVHISSQLQLPSRVPTQKSTRNPQRMPSAQTRSPLQACTWTYLSTCQKPRVLSMDLPNSTLLDNNTSPCSVPEPCDIECRYAWIVWSSTKF